MVNVKFNDECKESLLQGVQLITDAVATTFGPNADNVCIYQSNGVKITKDGATVCRAVNDPDPYVQMGIELVRKASVRVAKRVGDGSSTVCVLIRELINKCKDTENPIQTFRDLKEEVAKVIDYLDKNKIIINSDDVESLRKVATLSANGDKTIGDTVAEVFNKVGKTGIVQIEQSDELKDRVDYSTGFRIKSGYKAPYFVNTAKGTCELENVYVHISDVKMEEVKELAEIADKALKNKQSLLVIAPGFDSELIVFLKSNLDLLKSCAVISPNFRSYRQTLIEDIQDLLGPSSTCKKVVVTRDTTTFSGYTSNQVKIENKIQDLKAIVAENALSETEMNFHKERLANFTSGIATIYVGGISEAEISERYDRYEDAVMATEAALVGGILPGGGMALLKSAIKYPGMILDPILKAPYNELRVGDLDIPEDFWYGWNWRTTEVGNLYDMGIVDPFLVVKTALEEAVSTGGIILTCKCSILNLNNYD